MVGRTASVISPFYSLLSDLNVSQEQSWTVWILEYQLIELRKFLHNKGLCLFYFLRILKIWVGKKYNKTWNILIYFTQIFIYFAVKIFYFLQYSGSVIWDIITKNKITDAWYTYSRYKPKKTLKRT